MQNILFKVPLYLGLIGPYLPGKDQLNFKILLICIPFGGFEIFVRRAETEVCWTASNFGTTSV